MTTSPDLAAMLAAGPPAKIIPFRPPPAWTPRREVSEDEATIVTQPLERDTFDKDTVIRDAGLNPAQWELTNYRSSEWQTHDGSWLESHRLSLKPLGPESQRVDLDDLLSRITPEPPHVFAFADDRETAAYVHATGDWQLGKVDGDGIAGTVDRITRSIAESKARVLDEGTRHVHLAFLGDCIEGFVSQGGANAWRTGLTLTEQIRLVRRLMLAHIEAFARVTDRLTVVAVPGNHDEAVRFGKAGVTRFDDSFAVDALSAVQDAVAQNPQAYGHVEFYVPSRDSLTVTLDVAGTIITHAHGHQWRGGKHWEWLDAHAGNRQQEGAADVLLAAHSHHLVIQERGPRTFAQIPAMESESTWWKNRTGQGGAPGVLTFVTRDGVLRGFEVLR